MGTEAMVLGKQYVQIGPSFFVPGGEEFGKEILWNKIVAMSKKWDVKTKNSLEIRLRCDDGEECVLSIQKRRPSSSQRVMCSRSSKFQMSKEQ